MPREVAITRPRGRGCGMSFIRKLNHEVEMCYGSLQDIPVIPTEN